MLDIQNILAVVATITGLPAEEEENDAEGDGDVDQNDQAEEGVGHHWQSA